jgi:hypothetical protein
MTEHMGDGPHPTPEESQEKADEFDASFADPHNYAIENFTGSTPTKEQQYEAARVVQKEQQTARKGRHRK